MLIIGRIVMARSVGRKIAEIAFKGIAPERQDKCDIKQEHPKVFLN
jgi:hypothetical protein